VNQDYSVQFLKLVGESFAWIGGIALVLGSLAALALIGHGDVPLWFLPLSGPIAAAYAVMYSVIPVFIFAGFVVTLRAFGRRP